jgi:predicted nucleotidyltransferase
MAALQMLKIFAQRIQRKVAEIDPDAVCIVFGSVAHTKPFPNDLDMIIISDILSSSADDYGITADLEYREESNQEMQKWFCDLIGVETYIPLDLTILDKVAAEIPEYWNAFKEVQKDPKFIGNVLSQYLIVDNNGICSYSSPHELADRLEVPVTVFGL